MNSTIRSTTMWTSRPLPSTRERCNRQTAFRPHKWQTAVRAVRHQFDPLTIGFLVGGVTFATGGCILGVYMPYHNPVGVNISMLWWSIFLGIIGAYVGACVGQLFGIWDDQAASSSPGANASKDRRKVLATTEATPSGDPVASSVIDDGYSETLVGEEYFVPGEDCQLHRWLVHFRSGTDWYAVGEFLALNAQAAIERAIEVLGEGAGYKAEEIPWDAAPLCCVKSRGDSARILSY